MRLVEALRSPSSINLSARKCNADHEALRVALKSNVIRGEMTFDDDVWLDRERN